MKFKTIYNSPMPDKYSEALAERLNKQIRDEIHQLENIRAEIKQALKGKNLIVEDSVAIIEKKMNS